MPVSTVLSAVPAAAAALAYVNARGSLWYDWRILRGYQTFIADTTRRERLGTLSPFSDLERFALAPDGDTRTLLLFEDKSYSYARAYDLALRYGQWLQTRFRVKRGDLVAMNFTNSDRFIFIWLGLWSIGARPAFINYNLTGQPLIHCLKVAATSLLLIDESVVSVLTAEVKDALPGLHVHVFGEASATEASAAPATRVADAQILEHNVEDLAILIYTSGTTGMPKGAVVSWGKVHGTPMISSRTVGIKPTDILYTVGQIGLYLFNSEMKPDEEQPMPLYHVAAALAGFINMLLLGATMALSARFSTKTFWPEVRQHKVTIIQYVGETLRYLLAAPVETDPITGQNLDKKHQVRVAMGNGLRPDIWDKFKERFGIETIAEMYGATEGTFMVMNVSSNSFGTGAVGRRGWFLTALSVRDYVIVDIDPDNGHSIIRNPRTGFCQISKRGQPGELMARMPSSRERARAYGGYFGNEKATESKVVRDAFAKGDTWFRTGDLMRWDNNGQLFFHDRLGDSFRWKAENVSTMEVAGVVSGHPAVEEANVYGVEVPHHDGRAGCAAIVWNAKEMEGMDRGTLMRSVVDHIANQLPKYAVPLFIRVLASSDAYKTGTNKQQKSELRSQGVDPALTKGDLMYWLQDGTYTDFGRQQWTELHAGHAKL